jgi:nicotinamide-nucleotide amidase
MNAIILSIGDELILGQTIDTNSAWLSQQLAAVGCEIHAHQTVPDDQPAIEIIIHYAASRCDFLIISGGIGPTEDDLTRQALAGVLRQPLEPNEKWLHRMEAFFRKLGRQMPESNKIQAMIPHGATMIENTVGTAAGIDAIVQPQVYRSPRAKVPDKYMDQMFGSGTSGRRKRLAERADELFRRFGYPKPTRIFAIPGVPKEMKAMFTSHILPIISAAAGGAVILSRTLHTFGLGESAVAEKLADLMSRSANPSVGTTVANGLVSLRINSRFPSKEEAQNQLDQTTQACKQALGDLIFGQDEESLPQVVANLLTSNKQQVTSNTVATAESCTGGLLAKLLTDIPGSSSYFTQGWITYSNQSKYERLGVSMEIINLNGAVSEPVVEAMARNARRLSKSTFALAISGIAGPTGGSPTKPVGTVCIALAFPPLPPGEGRGEGRSPNDPAPRDNPSLSQVQTRTFLFPGDRESIRDRAAKTALTMLRYHLLQKPMPF